MADNKKKESIVDKNLNFRAYLCLPSDQWQQYMVEVVERWEDTRGLKLKGEWFQRGELHTKHGYAEAEANITKKMYQQSTDRWGNEIFRKIRLIDVREKKHTVAIANKRSRNQSGE